MKTKKVYSLFRKGKFKKRISKKCVVCGSSICLIVYKDSHYKGGHYFGTMKIPIGKGEHKKVGEVKLGKIKGNVVKWTGKEKTVEYWECNKCYGEAIHESWLEDILRKLYGKRCPDYNDSCGCCQAWGVYDTITDHNRGKL